MRNERGRKIEARIVEVEGLLSPELWAHRLNKSCLKAFWHTDCIRVDAESSLKIHGALTVQKLIMKAP